MSNQLPPTSARRGSTAPSQQSTTNALSSPHKKDATGADPASPVRNGNDTRRTSSFALDRTAQAAGAELSSAGFSMLRRSSSQSQRRSFAGGGVVSVGTSFETSTRGKRPSLSTSSAFGPLVDTAPTSEGHGSPTQPAPPQAPPVDTGRTHPTVPVAATSPVSSLRNSFTMTKTTSLAAPPIGSTAPQALDPTTVMTPAHQGGGSSGFSSLSSSPVAKTPSGTGARAARNLSSMGGSKSSPNSSLTPRRVSIAAGTSPPSGGDSRSSPPMPPLGARGVSESPSAWKQKPHSSRVVAAVLESRTQPSPVLLPSSAMGSIVSASSPRGGVGRVLSDSVRSLEGSGYGVAPTPPSAPLASSGTAPRPPVGASTEADLKTFPAFDGASPPLRSLEEPSPRQRQCLVDGDISVTLEALGDEFDDDDDDNDDDEDDGGLTDSDEESPIVETLSLIEVKRLPTKKKKQRPAAVENGRRSTSSVVSASPAPLQGRPRRDTLSAVNTSSTARSPKSPRSPLEEMLGSTLFTKRDSCAHKMNMSFSSNRVEDVEGNPDTVNNFSFYGKIGEGACGVVFKALDEEAMTEHAVKELKRPAGGPDTITEVRVMKALPPHPHICPLVEIIDDAESKKVLMVMPLCAGGAVAEVDAGTFTCKTLPPASVCALAIQIASALRHCHEHGIVHGDIKPENILTDGKPPRRHSGAQMAFQFPLHAYLADFGAATISTENTLGLSRRSSDAGRFSDEEDDDMHHHSLLGMMGLGPRVGGSPAYLAPELLIGTQKPTEHTDMWAFGVTLFALLFGTHPFPSESILELREKVSKASPQYPKAQREVAELRPWRLVLDGLLDKDPSKRWTAEKLLMSSALARAVQLVSPALPAASAPTELSR